MFRRDGASKRRFRFVQRFEPQRHMERLMSLYRINAVQHGIVLADVVLLPVPLVFHVRPFVRFSLVIVLDAPVDAPVRDDFSASCHVPLRFCIV
jgi:hypothetical protein